MLCFLRERSGDGNDPKSPEWCRPLEPPSASQSTSSGISGAQWPTSQPVIEKDKELQVGKKIDILFLMYNLLKVKCFLHQFSSSTQSFQRGQTRYFEILNFESNRFDVPQAVPLCLVCACLIQRCVVIEEAFTATRVFVKVQQEAVHCAQVPFVGATSPLSCHPHPPSTGTAFISSLCTPVLSLGDTGSCLSLLNRGQGKTRCFLIMSAEALEVKVSLIITMFYRSFANPIKTNRYSDGGYDDTLSHMKLFF